MLARYVCPLCFSDISSQLCAFVTAPSSSTPNGREDEDKDGDPDKTSSTSATMAIQKIHARSIYDSRGNPTIEVDLITETGLHRAAVPSGQSLLIYPSQDLFTDSL